MIKWTTLLQNRIKYPQIFLVQIFYSRRNKNIEDPWWELFMWAVVCNLPDMAHFLWLLGEDQMAKSLIAAKAFEVLAEDDASYDEEVTQSFIRSAT